METERNERRIKAARGDALNARKNPAIVTACRSELLSTMTVEQGFHVIAMNCLSHVDGNVYGVAQGNDPESVHQMRVGLRRLQSALAQFKKIIVLPQVLQSDLDWLGGKLGAARDWEVLSGNTLLLLAAKFPGDADLAGLQNTATAIARNKRAAAARAVSSARYAHLMREFSGWIRDAKWREIISSSQRDALSGSLQKFAGHAIKNRHRKLLKLGMPLAHTEAAQRHRIRIAAKKVRYTTEFFASLYPDEKVKRFVLCLAKLQALLGNFNDTRVAAVLLQKVGALHPELIAVCGFAQGYLAAQDEKNCLKLNAQWEKIRKMPVPVK